MRTLGRGVTPIRMAIIKYLSEAFPVMRQRALREWSVKPEALPAIHTYSPFDSVGVNSENAPLITVDVRRATTFDSTDLSEANEESHGRYNVLMTLWAISPKTEAGMTQEKAQWRVTQQRDDLAAVVRACLFDKPSMKTDFLVFQKRGYTEEYILAAPTNTSTQSYMAGVQFAFEVQAEEWLTTSPIGEAKIITVDARVVNDLTDDDPFNLGLIP